MHKHSHNCPMCKIMGSSLKKKANNISGKELTKEEFEAICEDPKFESKAELLKDFKDVLKDHDIDTKGLSDEQVVEKYVKEFSNEPVFGISVANNEKESIDLINKGTKFYSGYLSEDVTDNSGGGFFVQKGNKYQLVYTFNM